MIYGFAFFEKRVRWMVGRTKSYIFLQYYTPNRNKMTSFFLLVEYLGLLYLRYAQQVHKEEEPLIDISIILCILQQYAHPRRHVEKQIALFKRRNHPHLKLLPSSFLEGRMLYVMCAPCRWSLFIRYSAIIWQRLFPCLNSTEFGCMRIILVVWCLSSGGSPTIWFSHRCGLAISYTIPPTMLEQIASAARPRVPSSYCPYVFIRFLCVSLLYYRV